MRPLLLLLLVVLHAVSVRADDGDPKVLAIPADKTSLAKKLVRQLNDDDVDVRERASAGLAKLGRLALPAMLDAKRKPASQEVELRLDKLLPAARKADFEACYPVFLADKGGKYDHDFVGWNELKSVTKDTPESRKLFAAILASEESRKSLVAALDKSKEGREKFEKRWEEKYPLLINKYGRPAIEKAYAVLVVAN